MKKLLLILLILLPSVSARAQQPSPEQRAKAKDLYERAKTHYRSGELDKAAAEFKESYETYPKPETLFNLAQTHRLLKNYEKAIFYYKQYLSSASVSDSDRKTTQERIADLENLVKEQQKAQTAPPQGPEPPSAATEPAGETPTAGTQSSKTPAPAPATREPNPTELRAARTKRIAGFAVGGFGVVALALGGVFTGLASDANRHIVTGNTWSSSTEDRRNTYQALDAAFFAIGGVAVATGVVLYLIGRHDERKRYPVERVQLTPAVGTRFAGLNLAGGF